MSPFERHQLVKETDGYVLVLFIDLNTEISGPLGNISKEEHKNLRTHVEEYIAQNCPDLRIKAARVAAGTLIIASFTFSTMGTASAYATDATSPPIHTVQAGDSLSGIDGVYRTGSTGLQVKMLQGILVSFGYSIRVDGVYGPQTANVISQLQKKFPQIKADGIYGPQTKASLQTLLNNHFHLVTNPADILVLVNRSKGLPADYVPPDLVVPNIPFNIQENVPQKQMRKEAAQALEQLFSKATQANISLTGVSAYRSYDRQAQIFARNVLRSPGEAQFSAPPGASEHQTGLAIDVSGPSNNYQLTQSFGDTPEGQWLKQNASQFGFIIRYTHGKETITGYQSEPWHIRYVGIDVAQHVTRQGITLEEYLGSQ